MNTHGCVPIKLYFKKLVWARCGPAGHSWPAPDLTWDKSCRHTVLEVILSEWVKVAQSCPALCDPMDYTVHGLLQDRLYWVGLKVCSWFSVRCYEKPEWTVGPTQYINLPKTTFLRCTVMVIFSGVSVVKHPSAIQEAVYNVGDVGSNPGSGRSPERGNDNPLQYSCLGHLTDRGAWQASVHGVTLEHWCWKGPLVASRLILLFFRWTNRGSTKWSEITEN